MIKLVNLSKSFGIGRTRKVIADHINLTLDDGTSVALLGKNGAGKSSLLKLVAGLMRPDSGTVETSGSISWPVGFAGSFHPDLSGAQNSRFLARIYGVDTQNFASFVEDFADIGPHFHLPLKTYSSGMRARLAFGASMGIAFDTYLVDEVTAVGDRDFREKSEAYLLDRLKSSGSIVVSHNVAFLKRVCDCGIVLDQGRAVFFPSLDEAMDYYRSFNPETPSMVGR